MDGGFSFDLGGVDPIDELSEAVDTYHAATGQTPGIVVDWMLVAVVSNPTESGDEVHTCVTLPSGTAAYRAFGMAEHARVITAHDLTSHAQE